MQPCLSRRMFLGLGAAFWMERRLSAAAPDWRLAEIPPDVTVDFSDQQGRSLSLQDFYGRPMLLHVWATWCAPCVFELPALDRLLADMKERLAVVALSVDPEGMPVVLDALRRLSVRSLSPFVDKSGQAISLLGIEALPSTIAISREGEFLRIRRGSVDWDDREERDNLRTIFEL